MSNKFRDLLLMLLFCCPLLRSQTSMATLLGRVEDPSRVSISIADVQVVIVEHSGFQRFEQTSRNVEVGHLPSLVVVLSIGASPESAQWNASIQQELRGEFVGKVGYVAANGNHLS